MSGCTTSSGSSSARAGRGVPSVASAGRSADARPWVWAALGTLNELLWIHFFVAGNPYTPTVSYSLAINGNFLWRFFGPFWTDVTMYTIIYTCSPAACFWMVRFADGLPQPGC